MRFKLYFHPLSSFCQKVLIALYENGIEFEREIVDLMSETGSAAFKAIWPVGRFPVLRDSRRDRVIPESSIIIEYLQHHAPGATSFVPASFEAAHEVRFWDRFFDLHVNVPMQTIVTDRLRPPGTNDPLGVEEARQRLATAYGILNGALADRAWAAGEDFSMADCAAAPALFYADMIIPLAPFPAIASYHRRLEARPAVARVRAEAQPYLANMPKAP